MKTGFEFGFPVTLSSGAKKRSTISFSRFNSALVARWLPARRSSYSRGQDPAVACFLLSPRIAAFTAFCSLFFFGRLHCAILVADLHADFAFEISSFLIN
jgi:hypothetical protein